MSEPVRVPYASDLKEGLGRLPGGYRKVWAYTIGVLVQSNFGGVLTINGAPIGKALGQYYYKDQIEGSADGSCMMVVATDAPLDARNLKRVAKRAMLGLARTGGIAANGSGDYVIAFSTAKTLRVPYRTDGATVQQEVLHNDYLSPIFLATIEATEEAIINSLFAAKTLTGNGRTVEALPVERVLELLKN
jgi:D-aminopeptidase